MKRRDRNAQLFVDLTGYLRLTSIRVKQKLDFGASDVYTRGRLYLFTHSIA